MVMTPDGQDVQRMKSRIYMDGNQWCAVGRGFQNLAISQAGFGDTPEEAVAELANTTHKDLDVNNFEFGGFCSVCSEWAQDGALMDGCRDPGCPCQ